MLDKEKFYITLSQGKIDDAKRLTQEALSPGEPAETIMKDGLIQAMDRIGVKFRNGEIYIPRSAHCRTGHACRDGYAQPHPLKISRNDGR